MLITDEIFHAFLVCENKSYLKLSGGVGSQREFTELERSRFEKFKQECLEKLCSKFGEYEHPSDALSPQVLGKIKCHFIVDCVLQTQDFQSHIHALERFTTPDNASISFIPIRLVPNENVK